MEIHITRAQFHEMREKGVLGDYRVAFCVKGSPAPPTLVEEYTKDKEKHAKFDTKSARHVTKFVFCGPNGVISPTIFMIAGDFLDVEFGDFLSHLIEVENITDDGEVG